MSSAPSRARPREPSSAPLREFASPAPRSSGYRPEAGSTHSFALRPPLSTLSSFPRRRGPPKSVRARDPVSRLPPHRSPHKPSWTLSRSPSPEPTRRSPSPNLPSLLPAEFRAGPSPSCSQRNPSKPPAGGSGPPSPVPTAHQGPVLFADTRRPPLLTRTCPRTPNHRIAAPPASPGPSVPHQPLCPSQGSVLVAPPREVLEVPGADIAPPPPLCVPRHSPPRDPPQPLRPRGSSAGALGVPVLWPLGWKRGDRQASEGTGWI